MKLIVSLHDVAPPFELEIRRQIELVRSAGVDRLVLKVVPNWHGDHPIENVGSFLDLLRDELRRGSQLVLHGLEHRRRGPLRGSAGEKMRADIFGGDAPEFLSLSEDEARRSLCSGLGTFETCGLPPPSTFCPPAWLITPEGMAAARSVGIRRSVSMFELHELSSGRRWRLAGVGYMGAGWWQERGVATLNALIAAAWVPNAPVTRVYLHPQGARSHALDVVMRRIGTLVERGWQPVTFDDL